MNSLAPGGAQATSPSTSPLVAPSSSRTPKGKVDPEAATLASGGASEADLLAKYLEQQSLENKKREWAAWVETQYTKCKNARAPFDRQWYINLAFVNGKHYVSPIEIPGHGFRLSTPKAPAHRVRLVVNKIRTAVRTECSKLSASRPIPTVMPSTGENEDISAARIAELLLKAKFADTNFLETYRRFLWWGVVTGTSYMKSYWDPAALDYDAMKEPEPPVGPNGEPLPQSVIAQVPELREYMTTPVPAKGKICIERINPFHVYVPDLLAESLESQPFIIQVMTRSPQWVEKAFGFTPTADAKAASTIMESATIVAKGSEEVLDSVLVKEVWLKPGSHRDFPEGGVLTVINGRIVQHVQKWPWPFREYPFYKYDGIPTGGFYGDSIVVDLIPLQKEYNKTKSQIIEIKNTMGKPKLMYQRGSLNPKQISSEPGQAIPYQAGYERPTVLPAAEIPSTMVQELDRLISDFDDISGQHEITRGSTPSQVTSGTAIAFLQEQDDSKLSYQVSSIEHCIEMLGRHYLKYVSNYWDEPRIVRVTGRDASYESRKWKGSDLKGNTDVRVQTGSALPYSRAAKNAQITEWMQMGLMDPMMGMELLEMPMLGKVLDDLLMDKRQAQRENAKMADAPEQLITMLLSPAPGPNGEPPMEGTDPNTGQPVQFNGDGTPFQPQSPIPVNSWDNHEAHIMYHNEYRKSQEFELLPEANKKLFEMHVQTHMFAMSSQIVNHRGQTLQEDPNGPALETPEDGAGEDPNGPEASGGSDGPPQE